VKLLSRMVLCQRNVATLRCARFLSSGSTDGASVPKKPCTDPTAKRPNRLCDPYGQSGKPLAAAEAEDLRSAIHADWKLERVEQNDELSQPMAVVREFAHPDFLSGSRFLHSLAAVAQMNDHFPSLHLERRILKKNWQAVSVVRCRTTVLGGLSTHDFHLAMVRSVIVTHLCLLLLVLPIFHRLSLGTSAL
jgi:pterin-4a-carbinolamine dehydratase